jgi:hypothetical protein
VTREYRHTQFGWVILGSFVCGAVFATAVFVWAELGTGSIELFVGVLLLTSLLFGSLTVSLDRTHIALRFGVGMIRKRIALDEIRSYRRVRNPWYYGWGIHLIPGGWLYNVSGLSAVELILESGKYVRIGTDEPDALEHALRQAIGDPSRLADGEPAPPPRWMTGAAAFSAGLAAVIALGVFAMMYVEAQPPIVTASRETFSVRGGMYSEEIPMREVAGVALEQALPRVLRRTNGFAMAGTLRGHFRLDQLGSGQLFVEWGAPPYVVVRTRQRFVIVNFKEPERTRTLYADLVRYRDQQ